MSYLFRPSKCSTCHHDMRQHFSIYERDEKKGDRIHYRCHSHGGTCFTLLKKQTVGAYTYQ